MPQTKVRLQSSEIDVANPDSNETVSGVSESVQVTWTQWTIGNTDEAAFAAGARRSRAKRINEHSD